MNDKLPAALPSGALSDQTLVPYHLTVGRPRSSRSPPEAAGDAAIPPVGVGEWGNKKPPRKGFMGG
jgi:hypothetical protein